VNFVEHSSGPTTGDRRRGKDGVLPRIFMLTDTLETGGSERQFSLMVQALKLRRFELGLGCLRRKGSFLEGICDIREFALGGSFFTLQAQRARLALARHLRVQRIAVAHSFDFYSNLMLIPVARVAGVPVVIGSQRQLGDLLNPLQFGAQSVVFRLCDCVISNSRAAANRLLDQGLPESKVVVIPNGLPEEYFTATAPALPRSPGVVRVGMVARMNDTCKNHSAFLRAASRLALQFPTTEFLLVGDGCLRPELERMAKRLGLGNRVHFLGERRDIPAVLAAMDISVVPSVSESLPNAALESMAAGVPVVAARVGGNPEAVTDGETGLLVPVDDDDRMVGALEYLLRQPSMRAEYGRRGREQARDRYSLNQIRDAYEQLYTRLLEEKGWRAEPTRIGPPVTTASSRPVRVAIVAPTFRRSIGGQSVQADLLLRHWQDDPSVRASFIPIDPELPRWLAWVERVPYLRTVVRQPFYLDALWRGMKDIDIAHVFSASYWSFLVAPVPAWVTARLRRKKTLINYHSGEARDHLRRWRTAVPVLQRADRLVVPSEYLVRVFHEFGLPARVVPNIVDLSQFSFRLRRPLRPWLVCTRGFENYYSVDLVVRAFARVKKEFLEAHLCLVGSGVLEGSVRKLVRDLKLDDVEFAGLVSRQQIGRFYDQADIFINASWLDNMPVSILEAFASGTPIVSTAPEGIRYLVEHERTGLLCEPGDLRALGENVLRLLREPELALRLARNAFEESKRYGWEAVRGQWLEIYRSLRGPSNGASNPQNAVPADDSLAVAAECLHQAP
jgi:L-malate glycosyltransferase